MNRLHRRGISLFPCLLLTSCFTLGLWGFTPTDDVDPVTRQREAGFTYDEDTEWSWGLFGLRVLLTPLTLALDCVTSPVQVALGFLDDDDDCRKHREHGRR